MKVVHTLVSRRYREPGRTLRAILAFVVLGALFVNSAPALVTRPGNQPPASLTGQFLVASRQLNEPTFSQTVIYVLAHNDAGAMGLIVNRRAGGGSLKDLLAKLGIKTTNKRRIDLYLGGPVEINRGFVLHSPDYSGASTRILTDQLALSVGPDVMKAIADGRGPKHLLFLLGYAGWASGQLEAEIARHDWLIAPADVDLIFTDKPMSIWEQALKRIRISL